MVIELKIPSNVPRVDLELIDGSVAGLVRAATAAGLWVDRAYRTWCVARRRGETTTELAEYKLGVDQTGKDLVSPLDRTSEEIMAHYLLSSGFTGTVFGEEHGVTFHRRDGALVKLIGSPDLAAFLDGVDGTEHLLKQTRGQDSPYGNLCGTMTESKEGVLSPSTGAAYFPRQRRGFAASVEAGVAITYDACLRFGVSATVVGRKLEKFDPKRRDIIYNVGLWPTNPGSPGQEIPAWFSNLYRHGTSKHCIWGQRAIVNTIGPDSFANLVDNYPAGREVGVGPSVVVMEGPMLHDIAAFAPVIIALGGFIGDDKGNILGRDASFVPPIVHDGRSLDTVAQIREAEMLHKAPLGVVIFAQNRDLYETTLKYVRQFP